MSHHKEELWSKNYSVIKGFIDPSEAKKLSDEFRVFSIKQKLSGDNQVPKSRSLRNHLPFLDILCQRCSEVSAAIGESVLPTYTHARIYEKGSILKRHDDRDACEISLSVHLDGDQEWPFWIETPDGKEAKVILNPGDAIIYLGIKAEHWREKYKGEWYTQVFLHYVRTNGPCAYAVFDQDQDHEINFIKRIRK
tara:strand:+ start:1535 stop:2116 length:582 start_codon:yes stop_codon:yes gene_type:complete